MEKSQPPHELHVMSSTMSYPWRILQSWVSHLEGPTFGASALIHWRNSCRTWWISAVAICRYCSDWTSNLTSGSSWEQTVIQSWQHRAVNCITASMVTGPVCWEIIFFQHAPHSEYVHDISRHHLQATSGAIWVPYHSRAISADLGNNWLRIEQTNHFRLTETGRKPLKANTYLLSHRIHGAGIYIYMLTFGIYWWDPCY